MLKNNIVFSTDRSYAKYLGVLLYSILDNTSRPLNFFVLYSSLDDDSRQKLEVIVEVFKITKKLDFTIEFIQVDIEKKLQDYGLNVATFRGCFDPYTRLFVSDILAGRDLDKIIYLDVDMLCRMDLAPLLDKAEEISTCAGVTADTSKLPSAANASHENTELNPGLLVCSLKYLKELDFSSKAVRIMQTQSTDGFCSVQEIISQAIPQADLVLLNPRFNVSTPTGSRVKSAVLLHYPGADKPWLKETHWRLKKVYWQAYLLYLLLLYRGLLIRRPTKKLLLGLLSVSRVFINCYMSLKQLIVGKK